jgi:hypothetical protein
VETYNTPRSTFIRRIIIAVTLLIYLALWSFLFYAAHTATEEESGPPLAVGLFITALSIFIPYFIIYASGLVVRRGQARRDFLVGLMVVLLPVIIAVIDFKSRDFL